MLILYARIQSPHLGNQQAAKEGFLADYCEAILAKGGCIVGQSLRLQTSEDAEGTVERGDDESAECRGGLSRGNGEFGDEPCCFSGEMWLYVCKQGGHIVV